jgi:prepilin-type N-terminal cleavage/methylation domain-containing protein
MNGPSLRLRTARPRGGFTLIELLIALAVSLIGIGAAMGVLVWQNAAAIRMSGLASSIAQSQLALEALERSIRLAGTGIDPQLAFDFDYYKCKLPGASTGFTDTALCASALRDSNAAPDELVVQFRDPSYSVNGVADARSDCSLGNAGSFVGKVWGVTAADASTVTLVLKPGDSLQKGQVLQVACYDGQTYTYATLSAGASVAASASACAATQLSLYTTGFAAADPFNQPGNLVASCFSAGGTQSARAYAVRRHRYFLHAESTGLAPHTYLMLDQGLDLNGNGNLDDGDLLPIAADIEDLQIAYATEQPGILALQAVPANWAKATYVTDSNQNGVWGDDPGAAEQLTAVVVSSTGPGLQFATINTDRFGGIAQTCSAYSAYGPYNYPCVFGIAPIETSKAATIHPYRWPAWPGNIANVQVGLVARSPTIDPPSQRTPDEGSIPAILNRAAVSAASTSTSWYSPTLPAGRKRTVLRTSVRPVNMSLTRLFWN